MLFTKLSILLSSFIIESGQIHNFGCNEIKLNFHLVDCRLQEIIFDRLIFEVIGEIGNGLSQGIEDNLFILFEFEKNEADFEFEDFGGLRDNFELSVDESIFDVLEIHSLTKLKSVVGLMSKGFDN